MIKIEGSQTISREDREKVKAVIRRLVGLEIMDEDSKSLTLQFLPEPSTLDPEKIVRRMGSLTRGMLRDAREALVGEDRKMMSLIAERDDEVDRLYFLLVRAIRTATIDTEVARRYDLDTGGVPRLQGARQLHRGPRGHHRGVLGAGRRGVAGVKSSEPDSQGRENFGGDGGDLA